MQYLHTLQFLPKSYHLNLIESAGKKKEAPKKGKGAHNKEDLDDGYHHTKGIKEVSQSHPSPFPNHFSLGVSRKQK